MSAHTPTPWFVFGRPEKQFPTRAEAEAYAASLDGDWYVDYREEVMPIPDAHPLDSCPRCKSEAHIVRPAPLDHFIACKQCQLSFGQGHGNTARDMRDLSAAWNNRACNAHEELVAALQAAVARVEIANAEGDPIMSAWLPDARAALAKAGAA